MSSKSNPYQTYDEKAFWKRSVVRVDASSVDPVGVFNFQLDLEDKVATAGSCFAQHIARHLRNSGYNYYVVEPGHPIIPPSIREKNHYGDFSARYGNIYTAKQLLQMFHRAFGIFTPNEDVWFEDDGSFLDPYRPTVQPRGFVSVDEMHADRAQHLLAVRKMFETLDVFVFTLGLTECWRSRSDGAVFPLCPGVNGGKFDSVHHIFHNQDVNEVISDMSDFVECLREINPRARVVLTVSPVPLMATAEAGAHVLSATTYSKSVLRVAAEVLTKKFADVHYFPSFEIITGNFNRGRYYADDLRSVTEEGVLHVMRLFLKHATGGSLSMPANPIELDNSDNYLSKASALVEVECDEIALDRS